VDRKPLGGTPSELYDQEYFLTACEGHDAYDRSGGRELPTRLAVALELSGDITGLRVLDVGCGRGELLHACASRGAAMGVGADYAEAAMRIARRGGLDANISLTRANVAALPFDGKAFDLVYALDLVEHLYPAELDAMLAEIRRVLTPGGRLVVHTMPNLWYYCYGYPLYRLVQRLRGVRLPADPRERCHYVRDMHVNEQSVRSLRQYLTRAGFDAKVFVRNTQDFGNEGSLLVRRVSRWLSTTYPLAWIFCSDVFAVATA